jgi:hypothetical protein
MPPVARELVTNHTLVPLTAARLPTRSRNVSFPPPNMPGRRDTMSHSGRAFFPGKGFIVHMAADREPWDTGISDTEISDGGTARPSELVLSVRLLAASAAFKTFEILQAVYDLGLTWVQSHPAAWIELGALLIWVLLIGLLWTGNSFARTLLLTAMAWDIMNAFSTAGLVYAVGASQLLGYMPWVNVAVELCAGCLLLQSDCLEWFRKQN